MTAASAPDTIPAPLRNEEAEQALLGALLYSNATLGKVVEFLRPEHFFSAVHGRIYQAIVTLVQDRNREANPVTLKAYFTDDADLSAVGGAEYLSDLAANVVTVINAEDYGRAIHEAHVRRQLVEVGEDIVRAAIKPDLDTPPAVVLADAVERLFALEDGGRGSGRVLTARDMVAATMASIDDAARRDGRPPGHSTGIRGLDDRIGGLRPDWLYVVAGRPGQGKSALGWNNMALEAALSGIPVLGFSLEMSGDDLMGRMIARWTGIPVQAQISGQLKQPQIDRLVAAGATLGALPITLDDTPGVTLGHIRARARRWRRREAKGARCPILIVDHLHLMEGSREAKRQGRVSEVAEITKGLKGLAKELRIAVVLLAQLNRELEKRDDKRPGLADLRDSGSIEQDADVVVFVYREHEYVKREQPQRGQCKSEDDYADKTARWEAAMGRTKGVAKLIADKVRQGERGDIDCWWDGKRTLFLNDPPGLSRPDHDAMIDGD
jgi:replicative DNA helicase